MSRFRVSTFNHSFGRWLPTRELAFQDAIERREASRDPYTGRVTLNVGTRVEEDEGMAIAGPELLAWGAALVFLRQEREHAEHLAKENAAAAEGPTADRWHDIARKVRAVMEDARRAAGVADRG